LTKNRWFYDILDTAERHKYMSNRKFGAITSSTNPEEISNRVKGITLALSSVVILIASQFFNITLSANDVVEIATKLGAVSGAIWTVYGAGMSVWAYFFKV